MSLSITVYILLYLTPVIVLFNFYNQTIKFIEIQFYNRSAINSNSKNLIGLYFITNFFFVYV